MLMINFSQQWCSITSDSTCVIGTIIDLRYVIKSVISPALIRWVYCLFDCLFFVVLQRKMPVTSSTGTGVQKHQVGTDCPHWYTGEGLLTPSHLDCTCFTLQTYTPTLKGLLVECCLIRHKCRAKR